MGFVRLRVKGLKGLRGLRVYKVKGSGFKVLGFGV